MEAPVSSLLFATVAIIGRFSLSCRSVVVVGRKVVGFLVRFFVLTFSAAQTDCQLKLRWLWMDGNSLTDGKRERARRLRF